MTKLTNERYEELLELMKSKDTTITDKALEEINDLDPSENTVRVLALAKENFNKYSKKLPTLMGRLSNMGIPPTTPGMTLKSLVNYVKAHQTPEEIQVMLDYISNKLKTEFENWGLDFLKELDMKLTVKEPSNELETRVKEEELPEQ